MKTDFKFSWPSAKVICDSLSERGDRITTMEVKMHRFILPEFNTHRDFSRNSSSSRAIPFIKRMNMIEEDPAMPVFWGENQAGMSARKALELGKIEKAITIWLNSKKSILEYAIQLNELGLHKQLVNRLLEPFLWHTVIVTSTEWDNFFDQRYHPKASQEEIHIAAAESDAQPEMMALAYQMYNAYHSSIPKRSVLHVPYINDEDVSELKSANKIIKVSVARCARVSFLSHDGKRDLQKDIELFDKLNNSKPPHFSPMEHCAFDAFISKRYFNIRGWKSARYLKQIEGITF